MIWSLLNVTVVTSNHFLIKIMMKMLREIKWKLQETIKTGRNNRRIWCLNNKIISAMRYNSKKFNLVAGGKISVNVVLYNAEVVVWLLKRNNLELCNYFVEEQ